MTFCVALELWLIQMVADAAFVLYYDGHYFEIKFEC